MLEGCEEVIKNYKPIIILSVHPSRIKTIGQNLKNLTDLIAYYEYNIKKISSTSKFIDFREFQLAEYILRPNK